MSTTNNAKRNATDINFHHGRRAVHVAQQRVEFARGRWRWHRVLALCRVWCHTHRTTITVRINSAILRLLVLEISVEEEKDNRDDSEPEYATHDTSDNGTNV